MALVIGVTGGIGSGKTTVTNMFEPLGIEVVDTDLIAREVVQPQQPCLAAITQRYGPQILLADGNLNRKKLRDIVFADNSERLWLESVTHPAIRQLTVQRLRTAKSPYVILSSPLLLETDQYTLTDKIVAVDVDEAQQIERASARDGQSVEQIQAIMQKQITRQARLTKADYVIDNSQTLEHTHSQVQALHQTFTMLATVSEQK